MKLWHLPELNANFECIICGHHLDKDASDVLDKKNKEENSDKANWYINS